MIFVGRKEVTLARYIGKLKICMHDFFCVGGGGGGARASQAPPEGEIDHLLKTPELDPELLISIIKIFDIRK